MPTTIKLKNGSGAPAASDLVQGEPAFDLTNKRLYTEDSGGNVLEIGTKPSTIDINAGTIDGAVIGGASAAAGTFTTFTSTGIDDNASSTSLTIDSNGNVRLSGTVEDSPSSEGINIGVTANYGSINMAGTAGAYIDFTSADGTNYDGRIIYRHSTDAMEFNTNAISSPKVTIDSNGLEVHGPAIAKTDTDTTNTGSVTLDFGSNQNFVLTLTGNVTLANPSTEIVGQSGFIVFIQDGTGGRTVSLGTDYETANGAGLTLSSAASTTDIVPYVVAASGRILLGAPQLAFS